MLVLILTADESSPVTDSIVPGQAQRMQNILAYKFFGTGGKDLIEALRNRILPPACTWEFSPLEGATCAKGVITQILVNSQRYPNLDPSYVPPTVKSLTMIGAGLSMELQTCVLPRSLINLDVQQNKICGSFDMTKLPEALENVQASMNRISGIVHLCSLPPAIKRINFMDNRIAADCVFVANIPPNIKFIILRKNPLRALRPMESYELDKAKYYIKWKSLYCTQEHIQAQESLHFASQLNKMDVA